MDGWLTKQCNSIRIRWLDNRVEREAQAQPPRGPAKSITCIGRHLDIRHGQLPASREGRLLFCLAFIVETASTSRHPGVGNAIKWGPHKQPPPPHTPRLSIYSGTFRKHWSSTGSRTSSKFDFATNPSASEFPMFISPVAFYSQFQHLTWEKVKYSNCNDLNSPCGAAGGALRTQLHLLHLLLISKLVNSLHKKPMDYSRK